MVKKSMIWMARIGFAEVILISVIYLIYAFKNFSLITILLEFIFLLIMAIPLAYLSTYKKNRD